MKKLFLFWISIFFCVLHAETYIPYGNVSGIWETENSPYYITGQISIPAAEQLLIEPGVEVIFLVWNPIKISGSLQAIGTETEPITFTAEDTLSGWRGLRFYNTSTTAQDSSRIVHCLLEYGRNLTGIYSDTRGGAVYCYNSSNVLIDNCLIRNSTANYGGGISLQQSSIIVRNTIISGNTAEHDGGGLLISMESSPHLENCRFINNTCRYDGGGIFVSGASSAFLENMMIDGNQATDGMDGSGGGISCWGSDLYLSESVLSNNSSQEHGGGIELNLESTASLNNVDIIGNNSFYGGGLSVMDSYLTLEQVLISGNCAQYGGGGITLSNGAEIVFDPVNKCNLYLNFAGEGNGYDILNFYNTINVSVIVDTFTVENPTQVHTYPIDNFEFDIQNWKVNPTTEDVYVSPEGLDSNSGLSEEDPVKTIFQALLMAQATEEDPITIHLAEGFYSPSSTGELFPVSAKDYITISGSGETISILDAQGSGNVISSSSINYFALKDLSIQGGYAYYGGGIYCYSSLLEINNVTICNNFSESNGGGIRANSSSEMYLNNVTLKRNRADQNGGGLESYGSFIYLNSVTISENTAMNKGGGIAINNSQLNFNDDLRSNVYFNISVKKQGHELYSQNSSITDVIVDTFLVTVPTTEHANPISAFTFDILQAAHETISSDVYVSPSGNNQNSGTSESEPLQSIAFAIQIISADEENPATIHLAPGIYAASVNQELLPLVGRDHISLCGNDPANTILDAENGSGLIKSYADNLTIENLTLCHARDNTYNSMGVIEISGENLILKNLIIEENETLHTPGGLSLYGCSPEIENVIIKNNSSLYHAGGLYLSNSNPVMKNVSIYNNHNFRNAPGGIYMRGSEPVFFSDFRCSIYNNYSDFEIYGREIYSYNCPDIEVYLDTFTIAIPNDFYVYPIETFDFDILNSVLPGYDCDLYVSTDGSDTNSGTTPDSPFRTINHALDLIVSNAETPRTIHLAAGTYSNAVNGESYPIHLKDHIILKGAGQSVTILDGENLSTVLIANNIDNFHLEHLEIIRGHGFQEDGGGIHINNSEVYINNCRIIGNRSRRGGGIYLVMSDLYLDRVLIANNNLINDWYNPGAGIYCSWESNLVSRNVTISGNSADYGSGIYLEDANGVFINTIVHGNGDDQIYLTSWADVDFVVSYCDIEGGQENITIEYYNGEIHWLEQNIDYDPEFIDPENGNYNLEENSQCIDAGTAYFEWDDIIYLDMEPSQYWGSSPDIGCYEYGMTSSDLNQISQICKPVLGQNYPNPFNPTTRISFGLPSDFSKGELALYNIKGQKIRTYKLLPEDGLNRAIEWDSKDQDGKEVSSGVYLYRLKVNGHSELIKKCLLLK